MTGRRDPAAGITLVEMLVALVIFALVGLASFTTLDAILRARERTDGRLEHLARLDRALQVFGRDLAQADPLGISLSDDALTAVQGDGRSQRRYSVKEDGLQRESGQVNAPDPLVQRLIQPVRQVTFRVLGADREWRDVWPDATGGMDGALAVDMVVELTGGKVLRRFVALVQPVPK